MDQTGFNFYCNPFSRKKMVSEIWYVLLNGFSRKLTLFPRMDRFLNSLVPPVMPNVCQCVSYDRLYL